MGAIDLLEAPDLGNIAKTQVPRGVDASHGPFESLPRLLEMAKPGARERSGLRKRCEHFSAPWQELADHLELKPLERQGPQLKKAYSQMRKGFPIKLISRFWPPKSLLIRNAPWPIAIPNNDSPISKCDRGEDCRDRLINW